MRETGTLPTATVVEEDDVIRITFGGETDEDEDDGDGVDPTYPEEESSSKPVGDNIWTTGENALRDLLVYLVRKHHVDEVYDSKVKAQNWDKLMVEFNAETMGAVGMPKAQVIRKWHNWKQYNKQHSKPHPFVVTGQVSLDSIVERVRKLLSSAEAKPELGAFLAGGGNEAAEKAAKRPPTAEGDGESAAAKAKKPNVGRLERLRERDFKVRRTGVTASSLSIRKLEHEIALESLNYEQQKWKVKIQNGQLLKQKLQREAEVTEILLDKAKIELALKQHECASLGIPTPI